MKKTTIALFILLAFCCKAFCQNTGTSWGPGPGPQLPLVHFGERLPHLYYYDTNWCDYYWLQYNSAMYFKTFPIVPAQYVGRPCVTPTPMKIIGIAAPLWIINNYQSNVVDTGMSARLPEYFQLYQREGNDYIKMAETRWDTATPHYWMQFAWCNGMDTAVLYEAFFEKPVIVHDTFYVGGTTWNNLEFGWDPERPDVYCHNFAHDVTCYLRYIKIGNDANECNTYGPNPKGYLRKYLHPSLYLHNQLSPPTLDTSLVQHVYPITGSYANEWYGFFAIFDTTFVWEDTVVDTCACIMPEGLKVESAGEGYVVLSWNDMGMTYWEVEVGPSETAQGEGAVSKAPINFTKINDLDTAQWYWARVRAVCDTDCVSDWSDTVMFYIPSNGSGGPDNPDNPNDTTQAVNLVEQYTYLMPNPARDEVTVASSFRVKAVELYAADGKLLQQVEVNAVGTTLSLEGLPAGIYFVRVRTSAGVTTKRLVVE